jgi:hypothetical protein
MEQTGLDYEYLFYHVQFDVENQLDFGRHGRRCRASESSQGSIFDDQSTQQVLEERKDGCRLQASRLDLGCTR